MSKVIPALVARPAPRRPPIRTIRGLAAGQDGSSSAAFTSQAIDGMEIALGFLTAVAIGTTGVGAGIITAPVLILFFHVPPVYAVGTALTFGVAVKVLVVPMQLARKQVDFRVLGYMLAGGAPGGGPGAPISANHHVAERRGSRFFVRRSGSVRIAGVACNHSVDRGAGSGNGPVLRSLRIAGWQRIPVDCRQLRRGHSDQAHHRRRGGGIRRHLSRCDRTATSA